MDLEELEPRVSSMNREVEKLQELRQAYMDNPALGDLDTVVEVCTGVFGARASPS